MTHGHETHDTHRVGLRRATTEYFDETSRGYPTVHVETPAGRTLDFCGVKHFSTSSPDRSIPERVDSEVSEFLQHESDGPKTVMIEGWREGKYDDTADMSDRELVDTHGEMALVERRAKAAGAEIMSPEPSMHEEFEELCQEFPPNQVYYWLVMRQAEQWTREDAVPKKRPWNKEKRQQRHERVVDTHLSEYADRLQDALGHAPSFGEVTQSLEMLQSTHAELFGGEIDWNDTKFLQKITNPIEDPRRDSTVINRIGQRSNEIRDQHIAGTIKSRLDAGSDVFAVYGDLHAWTQKPLLESYAN